MIAATCFGTNDLNRSGKFYDGVLKTIGMIRLDANDNEIGYGEEGADPTFWVIVPFDREQATNGNGTQIIFSAPESGTVDRFHQTAMLLGATDEGAPGLRTIPPDTMALTAAITTAINSMFMP